MLEGLESELGIAGSYTLLLPAFDTKMGYHRLLSQLESVQFVPQPYLAHHRVFSVSGNAYSGFQKLLGRCFTNFLEEPSVVSVGRIDPQPGAIR